MKLTANNLPIEARGPNELYVTVQSLLDCANDKEVEASELLIWSRVELELALKHQEAAPDAIQKIQEALSLKGNE